MSESSSSPSDSFFRLSTTEILDAVESSLKDEKKDARATGRIIPLNSLENRVHEIEFEDTSKVVSKFYRPGRWSEAQLAEEHLFLEKLKAAEIPVVTPFRLSASSFSKLSRQSKTLAAAPSEIFFAVFPKVRGRLIDELQEVHLQTLGRYLGRIHQVGRHWTPQHRLRLTVENWGEKPLAELEESEFLREPMRDRYLQVAEEFLDRADAALDGVPLQTVHGDCHLGNTLWEGEAPYFLDFDDFMVAPAVQDIWMIVRGRGEEAERDREILLRSYESMCDFDRRQLDLIEILRGLRIIHYSAWIAKRYADPSFTAAFPQFGSEGYWRSEIESLMEILALV